MRKRENRLLGHDGDFSILREAPRKKSRGLSRPLNASIKPTKEVASCFFRRHLEREDKQRMLNKVSPTVISYTFPRRFASLAAR